MGDFTVDPRSIEVNPWFWCVVLQTSSQRLSPTTNYSNRWVEGDILIGRRGSQPVVTFGVGSLSSSLSLSFIRSVTQWVRVSSNFPGKREEGGGKNTTLPLPPHLCSVLQPLKTRYCAFPERDRWRLGTEGGASVLAYLPNQKSRE